MSCDRFCTVRSGLVELILADLLKPKRSMIRSPLGMERLCLIHCTMHVVCQKNPVYLSAQSFMLNIKHSIHAKHHIRRLGPLVLHSLQVLVTPHPLQRILSHHRFQPHPLRQSILSTHETNILQTPFSRGGAMNVLAFLDQEERRSQLLVISKVFDDGAVG